MTERLVKYLKAVAACAACIGVVITPEQQANIIAGFLAFYSAASAVQGALFKKPEVEVKPEVEPEV